MALKNSMKASALVPLAIGLAAGLLIATNHVVRVSSQLNKLKAEHAKKDADMTELKARYEGLVVDRNNVLTQTKLLLGEKGKFTDLEESYAALKKLYQNQLMRKQKLFEYDKKLMAEKAAVMNAYDALVNEKRALEARYEELERNLGTMKAEYSKKIEDTPMYKTLAAEARQLTKDNRWLAERIKDLEGTLAKNKATIKKQTETEKKLKKELMVTTKARDVFKKEKTTVLTQNKELHKEVKVAPSKFRTLAEENRQMLRETADMHYNLGVFYLKQKNYALALKEFHRALDFNPDNPRVHYNLGLLYADEYENHPKAILHLKRFLELDPHAKGADHARNYLMVREAYGDKMSVRK